MTGTLLSQILGAGLGWLDTCRDGCPYALMWLAMLGALWAHQPFYLIYN